MHICLVTQQRPVHVIVGGEERFVRSYSSWLLKRGHDVLVVSRRIIGVETNRVFGPPTTMERRGEKVLQTNLPHPVVMFIMFTFSVLAVAMIVKNGLRKRFHVIHSQDTGYGGLAAVVASRILGTPLLVSSHGIRYFSLKRHFQGKSKLWLILEYMIDIVVARNADILIAVSDEVAKFMISFLGIQRNKVLVIPTAVEIDLFSAARNLRRKARSELGILDDDSIVVGFVGRLHPEKNPFSLLYAFTELVKRDFDGYLVFIGTGSLDTKLKNFAVKKGLGDRVVFTGARTDVEGLLSAIDIFVLPSLVEGCPLSLLEAMAAGKAIVASNLPGISAVVGNGKEAILIDPKKTSEILKAILSLSPKMRARLGLKAQLRVIPYDIEVLYPKVINAYHKVCEHERINKGSRGKEKLR